MAKVIKEIIIMLLVCLAGMLLFAVIFYEYIPNRKVVPEVTQYVASEKIDEQKADDVDKRNEQIVKTFEVTSTDLKNFEYANSYNPGKANPFASPKQDVEAGATTNVTGENTPSQSENKDTNTNPATGVKGTSKETEDQDNNNEVTTIK